MLVPIHTLSYHMEWRVSGEGILAGRERKEEPSWVHRDIGETGRICMCRHVPFFHYCASILFHFSGFPNGVGLSVGWICMPGWGILLL